MGELALQLLGPFVATYVHQPLLQFRTKAVQALLVYLACEPEPHSRESLMTLLWPDLPRQSAQKCLRQNLYLLHHAIPALPGSRGAGTVPVVLASRYAMQFHPDARCQLDVATFSDFLSQDLTHWPEAVALYRGDFLADFFLPDSAPFEEWAAARRAYLRRRCLQALALLADHALAAGDTATAASFAYRQLEIDNLRENAYRQLMTALALDGQRTEALSHYQACQRLLLAELGVEPSPPTRALYEQIASGDLSASPRVSLVARPPLEPRHNLPLPLSSFIGRQAELAEVRRLLDRSRLVTLTGPGGCGKTRLVLQAAENSLRSFSDGVCFVDLAPLSEPLLVTKAVAAALGVTDVDGQPLLERLLHHLRPLNLLLLLDNCEHLVAAAAGLADSLLRRCPNLRILATSREALDVAGEIAWLVPTMSLPQPAAGLTLQAIGQSDAICLFVERAAAALPAFVLTEENVGAVVQVCRRLDGIPLAIELAAARVRQLRVEQIAARLDDRIHFLTGGSRTNLPRHQTLAATLDWSYDLLAPSEQRLLCKLAVFAGGFTLDAAETICTCAGDEGVLKLLTQLVNKSLVVCQRPPGQEARYHLLDTVREYALEKLREAGDESEARTQHAAYFRQLAELAEPWLRTEGQIPWLDRLEAELDNFRAALTYSLADESAALEFGVGLIVALIQFLMARGNLDEYGRWLTWALARRQRVAPPLRARLLSVAADLRYVRFLPESPAALLEESLSLSRRLGDNWAEGRTLFYLGRNAYFEADLAMAESRLSECLALAREVGDNDLAAIACSHLSAVARWRGNFVEAKERATMGLTFTRQIAGSTGELMLTLCLAEAAFSQREYDEATVLYQDALSRARKIKHRGAEGLAQSGLGDVARCLRDYHRAETFYRESLEVAGNIEDVSLSSYTLNALGFVAVGVGSRLPATSFFRDSLRLGHCMQWGKLLSVWGLARVALDEDHVRRATMLLAAARSTFATSIIWGYPAFYDDYERDIALARTQLGADDFAAAWAEGEALSLDDAAALALEEPLPTA